MGEVLSVKLDLFVFYGQLVVNDEKAASILQDWTEQDFSWEPGSVSFGTLGEVGDLKVEVRVTEDFAVTPEAVRAVVVQMCVSLSGRVVLSDCVNDETLSVPPGEYALLFEIGCLSRNLGDEAEWIRLTFAPRRCSRSRSMVPYGLPFLKAKSSTPSTRTLPEQAEASCLVARSSSASRPTTRPSFAASLEPALPPSSSTIASRTSSSLPVLRAWAATSGSRSQKILRSQEGSSQKKEAPRADAQDDRGAAPGQVGDRASVDAVRPGDVLPARGATGPARAGTGPENDPLGLDADEFEQEPFRYKRTGGTARVLH